MKRAARAPKREAIGLEKVRRERGLSQTQLAALVGYSQNHVSALERGTREGAWRARKHFSNALGVAEQDLFPPHVGRDW